ncbi:MAG: helix-turn-helix domain-containing protein [Proteobacteria bacterium]|nr:helix-turn-helix domain-containing protein [Pseudomonadota bacterium]
MPGFSPIYIERLRRKSMSSPAETLGLEDAARMLQLSEDCLLRKARAGKVPGAKIGRRWVFVRADLVELIRQQARERACHSIAALRARTGGSDSRSVESRLDARLAQLTKHLQPSSRRAFTTVDGGSTASVSGRVTPGSKLSSAGAPRLRVVTGRETPSG